MTNQPQPLYPRLPVSRRQLFGIGAGAAAAFGLAACGVGSSSGSSGAAGSGTAGGTLTMGLAATPDTLVGWGLPDGLAALRYVPDTLHAPELRGPLALQLSGPNPLRAGATPVRLRITLGTNAAPANYRVRVFDASGRVVRDLGAGSLAPGSARDLVWTGDDTRGHALAPGLYFVSVDGASRLAAARVIVLR